MTPQSRGRILIVDDDAAIRTVTETTLDLLGRLPVLSVASGQDAIERCRQETFDLILIDVMMPDLDGPATIRSLRHHDLLGDTPFAFLTAKVHGEARESLLALGAAEVIAKPFDPAALVETVRSLTENLR